MHRAFGCPDGHRHHIDAEVPVECHVVGQPRPSARGSGSIATTLPPAPRRWAIRDGVEADICADINEYAVAAEAFGQKCDLGCVIARIEQGDELVVLSRMSKRKCALAQLAVNRAIAERHQQGCDPACGTVHAGETSRAKR